MQRAERSAAHFPSPEGRGGNHALRLLPRHWQIGAMQNANLSCGTNHSRRPARRSSAFALAVVLAAAGVNTAARAGEPKKFFPADAPGAPVYMLPDPLVTNSGQKVTTAQQWKTTRRAEVLELFRQQVYGRVPVTEYTKRFKVEEDRNAMNGNATLKRVAITIDSGGRSLTFHLSLFVPNKAPKPAPAFLLICNRSVDNIDPTRVKKSEFWPAEEAIERGYAIAAFFNGEIDPDDKTDTAFKDGIHAVLDRGTRPPDAWGTLAAWAWGASRCMDYFETDRDIARDKVR